MSYIKTMGIQGKDASEVLRHLSLDKRNQVIKRISELLKEDMDLIIDANEKDIRAGKENNLSQAMIDRLIINPSRIDGMIAGLEKISVFRDPLGVSTKSWRHENGMFISEVSVPLGVIGMIYESRPNVTVDVAGLCLKSGNSVILRGGKEAIHTNSAFVKVIQKALVALDVTPYAVQLIEDLDREHVKSLIQLNEYVDVIIPRGGKGLKKMIIEHASVPVIETGAGLCHTYIDESANLDMALNIAINAKTQRTGVCNAMETLLVHKNIASDFLPKLGYKLHEMNFEVRACEKAISNLEYAVLASEEDWSTEYLDAILSIKVVDDLHEAIVHINHYSSGHSEAIVSNSLLNTEQFLNKVDAACVYVNASTRFTDGDVFGYGGEIGISTQKLHARGPMGIEALTAKKYIIRGQGQIRA